MLSNSLKPITPSAWDEKTARHLINRAGFGVPRDRAQVLADMSPEDAVSSFVDFHEQPAGFSPPHFIVYPSSTAAGLMVRMMDRDMRRELLVEERQRVHQLQAWWLQRMVETPRPLEEKLALFWHGHFATSAQKVRSSYANYHLNDTFRKYAAENFRDLTVAVAQSPAMLRYLDNNRNEKASPNENWARELMELFTMGPGHYTERDVREAARAFTGWTFAEATFVNRLRLHDHGEKTFLGQSGNLDGYAVIDIVFEQPATAEFIAGKLWTYFAYENPSPSLVHDLAEVLRQHNFEIRPFLRTVFLSEAFYADGAMGSQIKSPVECVLQAAADLGLDSPPYAFMARMAGQLGQDLFYPPNVAGWSGGRAWINANTLLQRYNLPQALVAASILQQADSVRVTEDAMMRQAPARVGRYVRSLLENAPRDRARHYRLELKDASPDERRAILMEALMELAPPEAWHVDRAYAGLPSTSPEECIDALADRLLGRRLDNAQRDRLVDVLEAGGQEMPLTEKNKLAALRLMMSLAEYQLV